MPPHGADENSSLLGKNREVNVSARVAFEEYDAEASKSFHDKRASDSEEMHQSEGGFLKPIIFGGLDGTLTAFAIVAGAAGGNLSTGVVLILGFSNIFADALSMGVGEFLSSKAENEWILSERRREEWEFENYPEGEVREMVEIFEDRGMSHEDAELVILTMAKYKDFFVDIMMTQELELQVPEEDHVKESFREGIVMFCSFATFGAFPILGYVVFPSAFPAATSNQLFGAACGVTGVVLFFLGSLKSCFGTEHWFICGIETLLLGGACATIAFIIGQLVSNFAGGDGEL